MVVLTEAFPLPGSSSSSSSPRAAYQYDVFLSFRGADTGNSFTDHLYNALLEAGIRTFRDEEEIIRGKFLKPELVSAIESSRASVVVFSKNYASSTWCLDELVLIVEQQRIYNQFVLPVFYHVDPTHVRKQQSSFGNAMAKHKERMEAETNAEKRSQLAHKIELWKRALIQVADLKGKIIHGRKETEVIEEVVTEIYSRLGVPPGITLPLLVGMERHIQILTSWLTDGSRHTANIVTIMGMGGSGKTSLAKYVYLLHAHNFYGSSFIERINTRCNEHFVGLLDLQKQLLGDISEKAPLQVKDASVYTSKIEKVLARKTVLVVLDDVDSLDQLDALLGTKGFHPGSKIIITSRDASLTERCALFNPQVQPKHAKVLLTGLSATESLELLCMHAFQSQNPKEGFTDVGRTIVKYCEGLPLALETLGKSLQKQPVAYWEEGIMRLKKEPHCGIKHVLEMSFHFLPFKNDKELFKNIACFFVGKDRNLTERVLNACGINTKFRINSLIDRGLLSIEPNNKLSMHSLIQEMGKDLVRQELRDMPWMPSRLWYHEESSTALKQKQGLLSRELKTDSLPKKLKHLRYLRLSGGSYKNFPELRWFPLKLIPLDLRMENLAALDLSYSNIELPDMFYISSQPPAKRQKLVRSFLEDKRLLRSLKVLKLSFREPLHSLGGLFDLPDLKRLACMGLKNLIALPLDGRNSSESPDMFYGKTQAPAKKTKQLVGSLKVPKPSFREQLLSLGVLFELLTLERLESISLKKLQTLSLGWHICLNKLQTLSLDGCKSCESAIMNSINSQTCSSAIMGAISSNFKFFTTSLSSSLRMLSLENIKLSDECFPADFSCLAVLEELCLDGNPIVAMPSCVRTLPRLKELSMDNCEKVISIKYPPRTLSVLSIDSFSIEDCNTWLRKITFDPEMSPLTLFGASKLLSLWSFEIDGTLRIQPLASVYIKLLYSLGWTSIEFIKERCLRTYASSGSQVYYEFGIFSTFFEGKEMPDWIDCRSVGPSISFTIPSSPKKLQGLNFCCVETHPDHFFELPIIKISNITKNHTWVYDHYIDEVKLDGKGSLIFLNHWFLGPNEMKGGDQITIVALQKTDGMIEVEKDVLGYNKSWNRSGDHIIAGSGQQLTMECGIGLVYNDDGKIAEEEEDVLDYYKSWSHIIGGDLSPFQLATGEYILHNRMFMRIISNTCSRNHPFIAGCQQ